MTGGKAWLFGVRYGKYERPWPICVFDADHLDQAKEFAAARANRHFDRTAPLIWDDDHGDGDFSALVVAEGNRRIEYSLILIARNPEPSGIYELSDY